jgi:hypothetical protein
MKLKKLTKSLLALSLVLVLCLFTVESYGLDDFDSFLDDNEFGDALPAEAGGLPAESGFSSSGGMKTEQEYMESLISQSSNPRVPFMPRIPDKDPFKAIVEKKVIAPPTRVQRPVNVPKVQKPAAPVVQPIKVFVSGIVGNEGDRLAIIKFENNEHTVTKDQIVEGKFKVVDIQNDRIVVYSNKEQRRHTFKIGGEEN